jgi:hypothetical protein
LWKTLIYEGLAFISFCKSDWAKKPWADATLVGGRGFAFGKANGFSFGATIKKGRYLGNIGPCLWNYTPAAV